MNSNLYLSLKQHWTIIAFHILSCVLFSAFGDLATIPFVLSAIGVGIYFTIRRDIRLISFTLWLYFLAPFYRRIVDLSAGRNNFSLLILLPSMVACLPLSQAISERYPRRVALALWGLLGTVTYALIISFARRVFIPGVYGYLNYLSSFSVFMFLIMSNKNREQLKHAILGNLMAGLIICGGYGVYQFVSLPIWDLTWMRQANVASLGTAEPGQFRIFGTLNSEGPFAFVMAFSLAYVILVAGVKDLIQFLSVAIGFYALLLTQVRSGLIILFFAIVFGARSISARLVFYFSLIVFAALTVGMNLLASLGTSDRVSQRLNTFLDLQNDGSFKGRLEMHSNLLERVIANPLGVGLGASGDQVAESGIGVKLGVFGPVGMLIFYFSFLALLELAWKRSRGEIALKAVLLSVLPIEFLGDMFSGLSGYMLFMVLGVLYLSESQLQNETKAGLQT